MTELQQEIFARLDAVAAKMGVAAEHFWPIFVRQQVIEGVMLLLPTLILVMLVIARWRFLRARDKDWQDDETEKGIAYALVFSTAVFFFINLITIGAAVGRILNPEYYALKALLGMLGSG